MRVELKLIRMENEYNRSFIETSAHCPLHDMGAYISVYLLRKDIYCPIFWERAFFIRVPLSTQIWTDWQRVVHAFVKVDFNSRTRGNILSPTSFSQITRKIFFLKIIYIYVSSTLRWLLRHRVMFRPREVVAERHVEGYALSGALQPQGAALLGQAGKARGR